MAKGFIYIMTNPALKDMVKIGYATDVERRRKDLSTTAGVAALKRRRTFNRNFICISSR